MNKGWVRVGRGLGIEARMELGSGKMLWGGVSRVRNC